MKSFTSCVFICVIIVIKSNPAIGVIGNPTLTLNGNSDPIQNLTIGSSVEITCTANLNSVVSYLRIQREGKTIQSGRNPVGNRITHVFNITCKDNARFSCYGRIDDVTRYSTYFIRVNAPCPPTPDIIEPVVYAKQPPTVNYYGSPFYIIGYPKPTFTGMKVTPQGSVQISLNVQIRPLGTTGFRIFFLNYTENEFGTYLIKAENIHGGFTANITYRGLVAAPSNLVAWSKSPQSIRLKFKAGETFDEAVLYYITYFINGEFAANNHYVTDGGDTITATLNFLDPEITYNIFVQARYRKFGHSLYSNAASATTIKRGDLPQTEPYNDVSNVPSTTSLTFSASPTVSTTAANCE